VLLNGHNLIRGSAGINYQLQSNFFEIKKDFIISYLNHVILGQIAHSLIIYRDNFGITSNICSLNVSFSYVNYIYFINEKSRIYYRSLIFTQNRRI
jgi:hypothetical protein